MNEILKGTKNRDINDFYSTDPKCAEDIARLLNLDDNLYAHNILEPCAGNGHISEVLNKYQTVFTNDLIQREYELDSCKDYLNGDLDTCINFEYVITNPPFKHFKEFVLKSFDYADKVVMFGRIQILESSGRKELNEKYLSKVYVYSQRQRTYKNGDMSISANNSSMCFCWFVYDKHKKGDISVEII